MRPFFHDGLLAKIRPTTKCAKHWGNRGICRPRHDDFVRVSDTCRTWWELAADGLIGNTADSLEGIVCHSAPRESCHRHTSQTFARPGNLNGYHTVSMILAHYSGPGVYVACRLPLSPALPEGESTTRHHQCVQFVTSLTRREEAQDLLEYALLTALIALIAAGAVGAAGVQVDTIFTNIAAQM